MRGSKWLVAAATLAVVGCGPSRWEFNWATFRFERVGPRVQASQRREGLPEEPKEAAESGTQGPQGSATKGEEAAISPGRLYRLYLTVEESVEGVPAESIYVVRHAPVAILAEVLALCYPGDGPGGSPRTRYILYTDAEVWEGARRFAGRLDEGPAAGGWREALDALYATAFPRMLDLREHGRVVPLLRRVAGEGSADADLRWASGIILAQLCLHHEPREFAAAEAALDEAGKVMPANSYEAMVVRYHQIKLMLVRGARTQGAAKAQEALNQFRGLEHTTCYQMIRELARKR